MGDLSCFLAQNAVKAENVKHVVSRRFLDKAGRPMEWEIQSITSTEDEALRRECTKRVPVVGKRDSIPRKQTIISIWGNWHLNVRYFRISMIKNSRTPIM